MVQFDITDYLNADEENIKTVKSWLYENVGDLDVHWYCHHSQRAHEFEGEGKGWKIRMSLGKAFRKNSFSIVSWILEIEDDMPAMQFKLIWPDTALQVA